MYVPIVTFCLFLGVAWLVVREKDQNLSKERERRQAETSKLRSDLDRCRQLAIIAGNEYWDAIVAAADLTSRSDQRATAALLIRLARLWGAEFAMRLDPRLIGQPDPPLEVFEKFRARVEGIVDPSEIVASFKHDVLIYALAGFKLAEPDLWYEVVFHLRRQAIAAVMSPEPAP